MNYNIKSAKPGDGLYMSGDVWDSSEPAPLPFFKISEDTVRAYEVRATRDPDWNGYFVFPLYTLFYVDTAEDLDLLGRVEGELANSIDVPSEVSILKGAIGVHRTGNTILRPRDTFPERHLLNVQNFDRHLGYAIVTQSPLHAMRISSAGHSNVVSCMLSATSPAQEQFLFRWTAGRVILLNISDSAGSFADKAFPYIERLTIKIDMSKVMLDTSAIDVTLARFEEGR